MRLRSSSDQPLQVGDDAQARRVQATPRGRPDAPELVETQPGPHPRLQLGVDDDEAVGLGPAARELGHELGATHPDRHGQAHLGAARRAQRDSQAARVAPVATLDVEEGLLDRARLDERGEAAEDLEEPGGGSLVGLGAVAGHEHLRPAPADLAERHTGVDAEGPGLVGRARDDLVRDDHRPPAQPRVVALLDRGEEGVGVGVQDHPTTVTPTADSVGDRPQ